MARLVYVSIGSLDGYIDDAGGRFDWAEPGEDLVGFLNDELKHIRTYLHGRRTYELMIPWETDPELADSSPESRRFADLWVAADKVVYSTTLTSVTTTNTRLEPVFDADAVRALKDTAIDDVSIDGPTLAAHALRAGLVDEVLHLAAPAIVGGGTPVYPADVRLDLELVEQLRFERGITGARYRVR